MLNMMRRHGLGITLFLIFGLAIAGVVVVNRTSSVATGGLKIGSILPLTGGASALGKASLNGIQLAITEYNSSLDLTDRSIELVIEDDGASPAAAVSAFQKLVTLDGVRMILGPLTSGGALALAPLANRDQVVILSPGASTPALTNSGDYVFRDELSEAFGARAQAELAYNRLNYRSIAMLYVNNEYGVGTTEVFRARFKELGGRIVVDEPFLPGTSDFRTALAKIKAENPDAMFVVFQDTIVNIVKQRAELGIQAPIYTTPVFEDLGNLRDLGSLADGIVYTYYGSFDASSNSSVSKQFVTAYRQRFHETPTYYAATSYDAARIAIAALRDSGFDLKKAKDSLYGIRNFPGVTGAMSFDHNGDVVKPVTLKTVRGGHFVRY